jgi:signal transduction histidine kinase
MLETKKNFVRYISHEIRTPLNTVSMGIQLARMQLVQNNTEDIAEILHGVEESCVSAVEILNDILLYDKIEDGRMELDKTVISVHSLVESVVNKFNVQVLCMLCVPFPKSINTSYFCRHVNARLISKLTSRLSSPVLI